MNNMINNLPKSLIEDVRFFLIEGKIDVLKELNPSIADHISKYADIDTTPTKKFVPWLVSQHKKGNVTSDNPNLPEVVKNFDKYKNFHGINDHQQMNYQDVEKAVLPFIGKPTSKKRMEVHEGTTPILDDGNIKVFHIKSKKAAQNLYGGGESRGGEKGGVRGTSWCVSARSDNNIAFDHNAPMYTIHSPHDDRAPYAVTFGLNEPRITSRFNDGDPLVATVSKDIPHLHNAINLIQNHHNDKINRLSSSDISQKEVDEVLGGDVLYYKNKLGWNNHPHVIQKILSSKNLDNNMLDYYAKHDNSNLVISLLNHPKTTTQTIETAAAHKNSSVALSALRHPKANSYVVWSALGHQDKDVALEALNHPKITIDAINNAGVLHKNKDVVFAALNHKLADTQTINAAANHPDKDVAFAALNHTKATKETTYAAASNKNTDVAFAAIDHPLADVYTAGIGTSHDNSGVRRYAEYKESEYR